MTIWANIYTKKEHQNFVLLDFFKSSINEDNILIENFIRTHDCLIISLTIHEVLNGKEVIDDLYRKWDFFLRDNEHIKIPYLLEKASHLFLQYPLGYMDLKEISNDNVNDNVVLFNSTSTNIKVLEFLQDQEEIEEHLITLFLTIIYVLGGYSSNEIINLSREFIDGINFSEQTKKQLNIQIQLIYKESQEYIENHIKNIYGELQNYYKKKDFPTIASKWKYLYKDLFPLYDSYIKQSNTFGIKQFRNQLDISDSETYSILSILISYFSKHT